MNDIWNDPPPVHYDNEERFGTSSEMIREIRALRKALEPFAAIKPSSLYPADGSEAEHYWVVIGTPDRSSFRAGDLRRARAALEGKTDVTA